MDRKKNKFAKLNFMARILHEYVQLNIYYVLIYLSIIMQQNVPPDMRI